MVYIVPDIYIYFGLFLTKTEYALYTVNITFKLYPKRKNNFTLINIKQIFYLEIMTLNVNFSQNIPFKHYKRTFMGFTL